MNRLNLETMESRETPALFLVDPIMVTPVTASPAPAVSETTTPPTYIDKIMTNTLIAVTGGW